MENSNPSIDDYRAIQAYGKLLEQFSKKEKINTTQDLSKISKRALKHVLSELDRVAKLKLVTSQDSNGMTITHLALLKKKEQPAAGKVITDYSRRERLEHLSDTIAMMSGSCAQALDTIAHRAGPSKKEHFEKDTKMLQETLNNLTAAVFAMKYFYFQWETRQPDRAPIISPFYSTTEVEARRSDNRLQEVCQSQYQGLLNLISDCNEELARRQKPGTVTKNKG